MDERSQKAAGQPFLTPTYDVPPTYGMQAAYDSTGSIVAPLLAGFGLTLIGLIVQVESALKWPSLALFMLTLIYNAHDLLDPIQLLGTNVCDDTI